MPVLAQLIDEYPEDIRVAYRHFPLVSIHDKAVISVLASEAGGAQGKFWEVHDFLYTNQALWERMTEADFKTWIADQVESLDLDKEKFLLDIEKQEFKDKAQSGWDSGVKYGFPGTPMLVINGHYYDGPMNHANLNAIVKLILLEKRQFSECPPMVIDPQKSYQVQIETEKGNIIVKLFPDKAPLAVNSFLFLVKNGWYEGVTFHRVLPGFVAQAGDPTGTGIGGPGYAFEIESLPELTFDRPGLFAMANSGPGTNGSQFFITFAPSPDLNGNYTIFGEVIDGMEVVLSINERDPSQGINLPDGDMIIKITMTEE